MESRTTLDIVPPPGLWAPDTQLQGSTGFDAAFPRHTPARFQEHDRLMRQRRAAYLYK